MRRETESWACVKMEMRGVMDDEEMGAWDEDYGGEVLRVMER